MVLNQDVVKVGKLEWFYWQVEPVGVTDKLPVVLLHGLPCLAYSWSEVMPALAEAGFRAVAPDWIGFGSSSKPDRRDFAYTPDAFVEALGEFLQALELERFHLVVQGFLGSVGLQYALRYPDRIGRLAILNAPVSVEARLPWRIQQLALPFVGDMMTQDPLTIDRTLEGGCRFVISDEDLDIYRRPFLKSSAAGRSLLYTVRNLQLKTSMAEIESGFRSWQQPTLIMWGMADPWLDFILAENFAASVPDAQVVKLEEGAHYPQQHWSKLVSDSLVPFLRRQDV